MTSLQCDMLGKTQQWAKEVIALWMTRTRTLHVDQKVSHQERIRSLSSGPYDYKSFMALQSLHLNFLRSVTIEVQRSDGWIESGLEASRLPQLTVLRLAGSGRIRRLFSGCVRLSSLIIDGLIIIAESIKGGLNHFFSCCNETLEELHLSRTRAADGNDTCSLTFHNLHTCEFIATGEAMTDINAPKLSMVSVAIDSHTDRFFQKNNAKLFQTTDKMSVFLTEPTTRARCEWAFGRFKNWWECHNDGAYVAFSSRITTADQGKYLLGAHSRGPIYVQDLNYYQDRLTFLDEIDSFKILLEEEWCSPIFAKFNHWS